MIRRVAHKTTKNESSGKTMLTSLIKNCLIVLLYVFLPWSLTCYLIIGGYYSLIGKKHDHTGDTGTAILFGAPLLPFILAYTKWQDRKRG
jgi:hypothetical protein